MDKSVNFIKDVIPKDSSVIVAVSGGPDSMALLSILIKLRDEMNYNIVVAHINHNLREESNEEYEFVKNYAESNKCIFEGTKFEDYDTNSIENEAREKRYSYFEELLDKYDTKYLCLAHHGDDLVETILMRLTRGSTLGGYSGFSKVSLRTDYKIIRPLIFYTKDEIMKYIEDNKIEYRVDKSNFSKKYTRNRYRLDILPVLKNEDPNIHKKYLKFSEELKECNEYIEKEIHNKYINIVNNNIIDLELLLKEDKYIIKKILNKYLFSIYEKDINLIESKHIDKILDIIYSNKPNAFISLPNNIFIEKSYNKLYVRNRKDGDYIEILNLNGKKKIKDLFIDLKIDKNLRDTYPLVVDSNDNIVWVPGLKKSKYDSFKTGKYDIILWYTRRNNNE